MSWSEIDAWARLRDIRLRDWEIDAIILMDATWMRVADPDSEKILGEEYHADQPMTTELFDQLMKPISRQKDRGLA